MFTFEDQIMHEHEMLAAGIERYEEQHNKLIEKGRGARTKAGRSIISGMVGEVADGVREMMNAKTSNRNYTKKRLEGMDSRQVAFIALTTTVDVMMQRKTLLNVARIVGVSIEMQQRIDIWKEANPKWANKILEQSKEKTSFTHAMKGLTHKINKDGMQYTTWTAQERVHVGLKLIDIIIRKTGLVNPIKRPTSKNKTTTYLEATPVTVEWIRGFNEKNKAVLPRYAPCLIPPKPWSSVHDGGYYSGDLIDCYLVRAH